MSASRLLTCLRTLRGLLSDSVAAGLLTPQNPARLAACIIGLMVVLRCEAYAADAVPPARASAQDCGVFAAIGKSQLRWDTAPSDEPMWVGAYGADCDWAALGTKGPGTTPRTPGPYYQGMRLSFGRVTYTPDGGEATVDYTSSGNGGPNIYFFAGYRCTLTRQGGQWQVKQCRTQYIT